MNFCDLKFYQLKLRSKNINMCLARAQILNRRNCLHHRICMNQIVRRRQYIPKFIRLTISTRVFLFQPPQKKNWKNVVLRAARMVAKCHRIYCSLIRNPKRSAFYYFKAPKNRPYGIFKRSTFFQGKYIYYRYTYSILIKLWWQILLAYWNNGLLQLWAGTLDSTQLIFCIGSAPS